MAKNLIVGMGMSGSVLANLISQDKNEQVIIIDKRPHIGGNCYDYKDDGITIQKYGSHIFHTDNSEVWNYITRFCDFNSYTHKVFVVIDKKITHIPFNFNTLYEVFDRDFADSLEKKLAEKFPFEAKIPILEFQKEKDKDLKYLADYIYEKIYFHYTKKQWGTSPEKLSGAVNCRVPVFLSRDDRYFQDKFQGIPKGGYSQLFKKLLNEKNIEIRLNFDYKNIIENFDRIFYTGKIDEYFNYRFGDLPYRSLNFKNETLNIEYFQPNSVVNYPNDHDFTRIHEYKYFLNEKTPHTFISREYPTEYVIGKNEPYYPIFNDENQQKYQKYLELSKNLKNTYFLGRLADYKYYDMDDAISRAIDVYKEVFKAQREALPIG